MQEGRSYETTFRRSLIICLYNDGKGIYVSKKNYIPDVSSRKFSNSKDKILMEECRKVLADLGWPAKKLTFEHIEMDAVFRCYIDNDKQKPEFAGPAKLLNPIKEHNKIEESPASFTRKNSDNDIDEEGAQKSNSYVLVEITSDSSKLDEKLDQLEKDLQLMLLRHNLTQTPAAVMENIVSYVFVIMPHLPKKMQAMDDDIHSSIRAKAQSHPMIYRCYQLGRFGRFFPKRSEQAESSIHISDSMSNIAELQNSSISHEILAEKLKQEQIETQRKVKASQMDDMEIEARKMENKVEEWKRKLTVLRSRLEVLRTIPNPDEQVKTAIASLEKETVSWSLKKIE
jgi:hypothetical protein